MSEIIQPLILPSWDLGNIAHGPYEAAFPELWKGLVFYADPTLGPTALTLFDIVGGNNGQLTNMVAADAWVVGERRWALDYDGLNQYVDISDIWNAFPSNNTPFTIMAWINPANRTGVQMIVEIGNGSSGNTAPVRTGFVMGTSANGGFFGQVMDGARHEVFVPSLISAKVWQHVAFRYDKTNGVLFLNGRQVATDAISGWNTHTVATLGIQEGNAADFIGKMSAVSVYHIALPESRIKLMAAGATPAMLAEDVILKAPDIGGLLLKQSNMDGGMEVMNGGFV